MTLEKRKISQTVRDLAVDVTIFAAFLIATAPRLSGEAIHEWLGIALGAAIVTHLLLHWQWIVATTKRIVSKLPWPTRINYLLNVLFFIDMTIIIFTGLMISKTALPALGIQLAAGGAWRTLHSLASDAGVLMLGLHIALHWQWIVSAIGRSIVNPILSRLRPSRTARNTEA
jgi:hypothetical protein